MPDEKIDDVDRKIISILLNDGRKSFSEISIMVGVSAGTVANRIKKLVKRGVIRKFTVEVDWKKLGFEFLAVLIIDVDPGRISYVSEKLYSFSEVSDVFVGVGGEPCAVVFVRTEGIDEFFSFMQNKVAMLEGVRGVRSVIVGESKSKIGF
ncbi:MAG: Lrp/AsnC family transcriptional regulator [Candidatus Jordarchaeales archaeon]